VVVARERGGAASQRDVVVGSHQRHLQVKKTKISTDAKPRTHVTRADVKPWGAAGSNSALPSTGGHAGRPVWPSSQRSENASLSAPLSSRESARVGDAAAFTPWSDVPPHQTNPRKKERCLREKHGER
jgi:hypothetical protein